VAPAESRRVVILCGGFGGVGTAQRLEQLCARSSDVEITLMSSSNYLLFTPMLAEVASSSLRAEHISVPIRASCPRTRFRRADVDSVDADVRTVRVRRDDGTEETLRYDHLVVAPGSVPTFRGLPGLEEHAFTLKTLDDANRVRNHALRLLEQADVEADAEVRRELLTFVVASGGFAGTGMIAELFDLVHSVLHYYPGVSQTDARFVLVDSDDELDFRIYHRTLGYIPGMTKRLVDVDDQALDAARSELGTTTIKDTVNEALRRAGRERADRVHRGIAILRDAHLEDRDAAWR